MPVGPKGVSFVPLLDSRSIAAITIISSAAMPAPIFAQVGMDHMDMPWFFLLGVPLLKGTRCEGDAGGVERSWWWGVGGGVSVRS